MLKVDLLVWPDHYCDEKTLRPSKNPGKTLNGTEKTLSDPEVGTDGTEETLRGLEVGR